MAEFTFNNQSTGSAYFIYETVADPSTGQYISGSLKAASGSFSGYINIQSTEIVQSDYIWGAVIPEGDSNFDFNPAVTVPTGSVRFRGTGNLTVTIIT
jgi:hypothetical protein